MVNIQLQYHISNTIIFLKSLEMSSAAARHSIQIYHFISSAMLEFRCHLRQGLVFLCIQDWNCFLNLPFEKISHEISSTIKQSYTMYFLISVQIVFLYNVGSASFSDVLDIPESLDEINQFVLLIFIAFQSWSHYNWKIKYICIKI